MTQALNNPIGVNEQYITTFSVAPKVWGLKDLLVNMYLIESDDSSGWVLVDAGLKTSAVKVREFVNKTLPANTLPRAIVLTHGHFDHVGSLIELANAWNVPIYAHKLEFPYLSGKSKYPPTDQTVGGGLMTAASVLFPLGPINVSDRLLMMPEDGSVPLLTGWKYIHTPGHSPGHISLFRALDKVLIAGDAFVTTQQESLLSVIFQFKKVCGPPKYFTTDWQAAETSVRKLAALEPNVAATGHGKPIKGIELRKKLQDLVTNFKQKAVPESGRYVNNPAFANRRGVVSIPPPTKTDNIITAAAAILTASIVVWSIFNKSKEKPNTKLLSVNK